LASARLRRQQRLLVQLPVLLSCRGTAAAATPTSKSSSSEWLAAGGLAGLALLSEIFQVVNTALFLLALRCFAGVKSNKQLALNIISFVKGLGVMAAPIYFGALVLLQVLPLMSSLLYIILAGAIFGPVVGVALVAFAGSSASMISALISRALAKRLGFGLDRISPTAVALDKAVSEQPASSTLGLLALLRLSPVIPFTFSNYLYGLSSLPVLFLGTGTLIGSLPAQVAYVGAGAVGQRALAGELSLPPALWAGMALATVLAMVQVGRVAKQALSQVDLPKGAIV